MSVERCDSICAYVLPYHSIFLHTHLGKSGKCRLEPTQTATTSSILCRRHGPIWPKLERHVVSCQHVTTCRRHFQLSTNDNIPTNNGAVLNISQIIRAVMSSTAEAKLGALFINAKTAVSMRHTLKELGHPQPHTPLQTDNKTVNNLLTNKIMPKALKAMEF